MRSRRAPEARGTELRRGEALLRSASPPQRACPRRRAWLAVCCACSLVGLLGRAAEAVAQEAADAGEPARGSIPSGSTVDPGTRSPFFPKTLLRQQRLPENLQGWMRDRRPARDSTAGASAEKLVPNPAPHPPPAPPPEPEPSRGDEPHRPLRSFEQNGITVLSNRGTENTPPAPAPALAAVRIAPAPPTRSRTPGETEVDPPEITETRSLRALDAARVSRPTERESYTWPLIAVATGGLGLAALWLLRRNDG